MNNNNRSYYSKLAYSVQHDYQRDAANYRLAKAISQSASSKSLLLKGYIAFLVFFFV
ncbi:MAG: hypothetical protein GY805_38745 [Chloroflexi bacterium]|nr:hypothetical protein [Chloroflexota bacterium]